MAKGNRRKIVKVSGPQPMYVVAGLPKSVHKGAVDALQARYPHAIIKGIPSSSSDGALYSTAFLKSLVQSVGEFVLRRRDNGNAQPTPASITLLYVPSHDQEKLLETFDFAVLPAPLTLLVARDEQAMQLRHNRQAVDEALIDAVSASSPIRANLSEVVRRLAYRSDNEALLLPPGNFVTQDGDLKQVFRTFRDGGRSWSDRLAEFGPTDLTNDDVPDRVAKQQTRHPFVDSRGMAFFIAHPTAYDGAAREVDSGENTSGILSILRSLYRFGGALAVGIHHDAQRGDGSSLGGAIFNCSEKGSIQSNSNYANIYPNDRVRVGQHTLVE